MATLKPIKGLSAIYEAVKKSWGSYLRFNETTKTIEFKEEELNTMTLRCDFWEDTGYYVQSASNLKKAILMVAQEQSYKTPLHDFFRNINAISATYKLSRLEKRNLREIVEDMDHMIYKHNANGVLGSVYSPEMLTDGIIKAFKDVANIDVSWDGCGWLELSLEHLENPCFHSDHKPS
jgi:hypothetical protein